MANQQGQPPSWPPPSGQSQTWYPPNQGWGPPQRTPQQRQPQPNTPYPQQSYQPPPQYYQQQPYYQQPPMSPPKKKSRAWLWIVLGIAGVMLCSCIGFAAVSASQQKTTSIITAPADTQNATTGITQAPTQAPTQVPTHPTTWTTTHTFQGNGTKKTAIFAVGDDWKIVWTCNPSSFYGNSYNLIVMVTGSDGSPIDPGAVNTLCKAGNTHDMTEEHQGGSVYLEIDSEGAWTVQVQELK